MKHEFITVDKADGEIDWLGCQHHRPELPYRAIVPIRLHSPDGPMLYQVAGSEKTPRKAENALKLAMQIHGGSCFYCKQKIKADWTLDHVEPTARGGKSTLGNLVVACKPCNVAKGHQPIDSYEPIASREWLTKLHEQIAARLSRLDPPAT